MPKYLSRLFRDDDTIMQALCLQHPRPSLLIGLSTDWRDSGHYRNLSPKEARILARHLAENTFHALPKQDEMTLEVNSANRGDPFRKGMEISLTLFDRTEESAFLEDDSVSELVTFILSGLTKGAK